MDTRRDNESRRQEIQILSEKQMRSMLAFISAYNPAVYDEAIQVARIVEPISEDGR